MPRPKKWTHEQLVKAAVSSRSTRQVLAKLGLIQAGGNYAQIKKYFKIHSIDTKHFTGMGWSRGLNGIGRPLLTTEQILVNNSSFQSYKLKLRLFKEKIKQPVCEECGWATISEDGRLPLELDHINGDSRDNRLNNLRVLCPNCHSLKPTHRGRNRKHKPR